MASLFIEENELVGIESPKIELIELLVKGPTDRTVISVRHWWAWQDHSCQESV
jgi:hypothetical protein